LALLCFVGGMVYWGRNTNWENINAFKTYDAEPVVTKKAVKTVKKEATPKTTSKVAAKTTKKGKGKGKRKK